MKLKENTCHIVWRRFTLLNELEVEVYIASEKYLFAKHKFNE